MSVAPARPVRPAAAPERRDTSRTWPALHAGDPYKETPSQTAGPYVHIGCAPTFAGLDDVYPDLGAGPLDGEAAKGTRIALEGRVLDGLGAPLKDALVEIWQADADGLHPGPSEWRGAADPAFRGWGRCPTDAETGLWRFETVKPGRVPSRFGLQAPHVTLWIVARGINIGLQTRAYFGDEEAANAEDPLLARIEQPRRRETLVAARQDGATYRFDIHLQGDRETVFLDI